MGRNIWYISKYAVTPQYGNPTRQYFLSKYLAREGHELSLIYSRSSMFGTPPASINEPLISNEEGFRQVMLPGPLVSLGFSFKRIWSWLLFEWRVRQWARKQAHKPDIVIVSSLSVLTFATGIYLKKNYKCKLVVEVRDIYPFTLVAMNKFNNNHPVISYLSKLERRAYQAADLIVSTLDYFQDHLEVVYRSGLKKYKFIPMGFDPEYYQGDSKASFNEELNLQDKFVVGYAGSFGKTQATGVIFEIIRKLADDQSIHFLLAGDGVEKKQGLKQIIGQQNFTDLGRINKNQVPEMLNYCDIVLNPWLDLEIYKYGISPNKWMDYMYAAKPIIIGFAGKSKLIEEAGCGSVIPPQDVEALIQEIFRFKEMDPAQRHTIGQKGRQYLYEELSYHNHAQTLLKAINLN